MKTWHQGRELLLPKELYTEMKENHHLAEYGQSFQLDTPKEIPVYEKYVKNTQLNFGPQHPAAHGVLVRLFFLVTLFMDHCFWTELSVGHSTLSGRALAILV